MAVNRALLYDWIDPQEPPQGFEVPLEPVLVSPEDTATMALRSHVVKVLPPDPFDFGVAPQPPSSTPGTRRS
jgi:hypothetical protein